MSAFLEFYAASWEAIERSVGCSDRLLLQKVVKQIGPEFEEVFDDDSFDGGPDFADGLERWIIGNVRTERRAPWPIESLGERLGFIALIKFHGSLVGSISHTSSSTKKFCNEFITVASSFLNPPITLSSLLSRPLAGFENSDTPSWGGLNKEELLRLAPVITRAPGYEDDPDIDEWLAGLWTALGAALELKTDLVTLYF